MHIYIYIYIFIYIYTFLNFPERFRSFEITLCVTIVIQNSVKHLRWSFLLKIVNYFRRKIHFRYFTGF